MIMIVTPSPNEAGDDWFRVPLGLGRNGSQVQLEMSKTEESAVRYPIILYSLPLQRVKNYRIL